MSIWKSQLIPQDLPIKLTLGEGNTPIEEISLGKVKVLLKREDKNPSGSFKDRSLAYQLSKHISGGKKKFCISSSGNAAISAYNFSKSESFPTDVTLDIFVSNKLSETKLQKLEGANLHRSDNPKSDCIKFSGDAGAFNLRGSEDVEGIVGYYSLADEIKDLDIDSIFIPVSSGNGALGVGKGLKLLNKNIPIYIVQSQKIHPIAKEFDSDFVRNSSSVITCITDRVCKRKNQILSLIKESKGSGLVVSDEEVISISKEFGLSINGSIALAGLKKQLNKSDSLVKKPLVILSGN